MRTLLLLLLSLVLSACPPERSSGADDDDATSDDDDAVDDDDDADDDDDVTDDDDSVDPPDPPEFAGCWHSGPGSDVPFAWGRREDALVLLAPDGSETVLHEGAPEGPMQSWRLVQAGGWMVAHGSWWNTNEDRGTVTALYAPDGDLVADRVVDGVTGFEAHLSSDGHVAFSGGTSSSGLGSTIRITPSGELEEIPWGVPMGPPQLGAIPVCQYDNDVCGWLPDGDTELLGALPEGHSFWPAGDWMLRFDGTDPELPAVRLESPWYPAMTFLQDHLPPDAVATSIVGSSPDGVAILGHYADWETGTWLIVDPQEGTVVELDLEGRGDVVDGGICGPSVPSLPTDGSLVFPIRDDATARFVRRDPENGVEEPLGEAVTGFLFAEASLRDGTWALTTGDGSDTFCGGSQREWDPAPDALAGNTIQLLRPADGLVWTLEAPPMASGYGVSVGLAAGGSCASVPEALDWSYVLESFDLLTGERQPFPEGFTFGGWLD